MKLFDALISPILFYASEVWGIDCKGKLEKDPMKLFDALISPILFYASDVWGIDCKGKLEKDPAELVQNKFLKWLLGVNKYCNNNASRTETGRFPMTIAAQCRKLSQIAYNDIKWEEK